MNYFSNEIIIYEFIQLEIKIHLKENIYIFIQYIFYPSGLLIIDTNNSTALALAIADKPGLVTVHC